MPWRECSVMEERLRFVARLLDGEGMSEVCREFGVSRKTGYKIFSRYKDQGLEALADCSRRPVRRFQGRVQARQRPLLLPPDGLRPGLALPALVRGP
jgi:transposase